MFGLSTPLEQQTGCLSETQTGCLDVSPNYLLFMFGGNNWNQTPEYSFSYNLAFVSATEAEFGSGNQTWQENFCYITEFTATQWSIVCYFIFNVDGLQWRMDGSNYVPWFQGVYKGFCCYPQPMNDFYNNIGGIGITPPKYTNGCSITLNAAGTTGIISKHTILSATSGSTPIELAPAAPLDIELVHLTATGLVTYTCNESQAIIFWIGLTDPASLPAANFNPEDKQLLAFAYPNP